jgi:hypothetical protein
LEVLLAGRRSPRTDDSNEIDDGVTLSDEPRLRLSSNQLRRKQHSPHRSYSAPPRAQGAVAASMTNGHATQSNRTLLANPIALPRTLPALSAPDVSEREAMQHFRVAIGIRDGITDAEFIVREPIRIQPKGV